MENVLKIQEENAILTNELRIAKDEIKELKRELEAIRIINDKTTKNG